MPDRCPHTLWDSLPAPRCIRDAGHRDGHTYVGDWAPDQHDRTEGKQDEQ